MPFERRSAGVRRTARFAAGLLAIVVVLVPAFASARHADPSAGSDSRLRNVLFLSSYQPGLEWSDDLLHTIARVLDAQTYPVELWVEHMDSRRFTGQEYEETFANLLARKYHALKLDAIVAADDAALTFVRARHAELFPGVPVVFLGINDAALVDALDRRIFTGVREAFRNDEFLDLALELRPGTRRFIVISDATETARARLHDYQELATQRRDLEFLFLDGAELTFEAIADRLRNESRPDDVVVVTSFYRDHTGRYFPRGEAVALFIEASRAPAVTPSTNALGLGLLASSENGAPRHGELAAALLLKVLDGVPPDRIPIEIDHMQRFVVDYEQMVRWGVSQSQLPPSAVVGNRPASFFQDHRGPILGGLTFMLVQAAVIGALVVNISRRRRAERELSAKAAQLAASNESLERLNASLRTEIEERQHAEDQLRQAQRIEAVGRLAGGIAHDFNNLLTVISSYTDMLLESLVPGDPARPSALQIRKASDKAAALTQQLLAFSRRQVLSPSVLDLSAVVADMDSMLRRLIPENVRLELHLAEAPIPVLVDRSQLEQVILNLVVNGRDAMPDGGTVRVETRSGVRGIDEQEARAGMREGEYAQLIVSDTGHGMDDATKARIFEPFFTTKEKGRGTGLGLSMVYGIVKQSGGWIWVSSEPGRGTTFTIDLPLSDPLPADTAPPAAAVHEPAPVRPPATETILLVEDQDDVRRLARRVLEREGYTVLAAASGDEALSLARAYDGAIHLLLSDVVMPGMSGRQVAEQLTRLRSGTRVLFMSGYTDNVIAEHGVLDPGYAFLSKPFTPDALAKKVRQVLETADV
ncbi:MAG TPA: ATP-binding protein [Vicinamibacterales bacterium]